MLVPNPRQGSLPAHNFAMNPRAPVQRSSFPVRQKHATTFSASYLVPIYLEEVMPGDLFNIKMTVAARTATPVVPVMDNWTMDIFFFYSPNRIVWTNWEKMMGAQDNPGDSIAYTVPYIDSPNGGYSPGTVFHYMGLPGPNQIGAGVFIRHNALPLRHHNKIYNDWFKDENLQSDFTEATGNGPDLTSYYGLYKRGKRKDYITAALPFLQKGTAVTIPLGSQAPVWGTGHTLYPNFPITIESYQATAQTDRGIQLTNGATTMALTGAATATAQAVFSEVRQPLYADLSAATSASLNTFRVAIATQQLLERDARGGTRYVETIYAHWGVRPPDFRLSRPEYIGGGSIPINIDPIPQTSATGLTGGTTPAGSLAATGSARGSTGFSYAALEHGYIIGYASVRADLTYSQGARRHWFRNTRYDFPYPEFAHLGEQPIYNKELYMVGSATGGTSPGDQDMGTFGYIPRYDECRHFPSMVTGLYSPYATANLAIWNSSELFGSLPTLNDTFIRDNTNTVLERNFVLGATSQNQQFLCDFLFTGRVARPLPTYAVPGLTRF